MVWVVYKLGRPVWPARNTMSSSDVNDLRDVLKDLGDLAGARAADV